MMIELNDSGEWLTHHTTGKKYKLKVNGEDGPVIFLCKEGGKDSISISNLTLFTLKMVWLQFYVLSTLELLVVYLMVRYFLCM